MPSHAAKVAASLARPPIDLRYLLPPIRSQGARPLCVPFAVTTTNEAARSLFGVGTPADILAVEPVWQHCVNSGAGGHQGTSIGSAAQGLANRGQPLEADWPYNHTLGAKTEPDPPGTAAVDWHGADMANLALGHDGVEDLIETSLALRLPVVLLIEQTDQFDFPDQDGEIDVPPINSPRWGLPRRHRRRRRHLSRRIHAPAPHPEQLGCGLGRRRIRVDAPRLPHRIRRTGGHPQPELHVHPLKGPRNGLHRLPTTSGAH